MELKTYNDDVAAQAHDSQPHLEIDRPILMTFPQGAGISVFSGPKHALEPPLLLHRYLDELLEKRDASFRTNQTALVTRTPSGKSVREFSYLQLQDLSSLIAQRFLHALHGHHHHHHHPKERNEVPYIAFCARKSPELCIAILGALKAGCAYVPIDYDWPVERFRYVLEDARPSIVVVDDAFKHNNVLAEYCTKHSSSSVQQVEQLFHRLDGDNNTPLLSVHNVVEPHHTALILYTSGTTGEPKGVKLPHRGLMNALRFRMRNFPYFPDEEGLLKTVMTFSDSALEMFETWFNLRPLIVISKEDLLDVRKFLQILESNRVYRMIVVPSLLRAILDVLGSEARRKFNGPMWMVSADGEPVTVELAEKFFSYFPATKLANFYGQTECCADLSYEIWNDLAAFNATRSTDGHVSIGRLIDNLSCYIVDPHTGQPTSIGDSGELYVSGPSVCASYIGTTLGKFLSNNLMPNSENSDHSVLLKTGDLAFYDVKKQALFLIGRADDMVKISGQKVHLIEIEKAMQKIPGVIETAVVAIVQVERTKLIGFVRFSAEKIKNFQANDEKLLEEARNTLSQLLPVYAQPQLVLHQHEPLPRTEAGKISKSQLLEFYRINFQDLSKNDKNLALGVLATSIGVQQNFIDLHKTFVENGGSSLIILPTVLALNNSGFQIKLQDFLTAQSVQQILDACNNSTATTKDKQQQHASPPRHDVPCCSFSVKVEPLSALPQDDVINVVAESFGRYSSLAMFGEISAKEMRPVIEQLYPIMLEGGLSFGLVRDVDACLVAVSLNHDNAVEIKLDPNNLGSQSNVDAIELLTFLDGLLEPHLPKGKGKVWHAMMDAILPSVSAADKVALMYQLFQTEIANAKKLNFSCIMAETASPLTEQLAHDFIAHQTVCKIKPKDFVTKNGRMPWLNYPDDYFVYGDVLWLLDDKSTQ